MTWKGLRILYLLVLFLLFPVSNLALAPSSLYNIQLKIKPSKRNHTLGEPVSFKVSIKNVGKKPFLVPLNFLIQVSDDGKEYVDYFGPGGGVQFDGVEHSITVKPGRVYRTKGKILWNRVPNVDHLAADVARRLSKGRLLRTIAFDKSGTFRFRILHRFGFGENNQGIKPWHWAQSNSVKVSFREPVGGDKKIWEQIKVVPEIAYFIQSGRFLTPRYKNEDRSNIEDFTKDLIDRHSKSKYAKLLCESLAQYEKENLKAKQFLSIHKLTQVKHQGKMQSERNRNDNISKCVKFRLLSQSKLPNFKGKTPPDVIVVVEDDILLRFELRNECEFDTYYLSYSIPDIESPAGYVLLKLNGEKWQTRRGAWGEKGDRTGLGYRWRKLSKNSRVIFEATDLSSIKAIRSAAAYINKTPSHDNRLEVRSPEFRIRTCLVVDSVN